MAALAAASILMSITVVELSSGDAKAINIAGSLRMQSYAVQASVHGSYHANHSLLTTAIDEFERRHQSSGLVHALPQALDHPIRVAHAAVGNYWQEIYKPLAQKAASEQRHYPELTTRTLELVHHIDHLVELVEEGLEAKLHLLRLAQAVSLILLGLVSIGAVLQLKKDVLHPLRALLTSAHRVRSGDFTTRVPPRQPDELGQLGEAFNFMVEDLSTSYAGLERRVAKKTRELARSNQSLSLLYNITRTLSERAVSHATLQFVLTELNAVIGVDAGLVCLGRAHLAGMPAIGSTEDQASLQQACLAYCQHNGEGGTPVARLRVDTEPSGRHLLSVPLFDGDQNHGTILLRLQGNLLPERWQVDLMEAVGRHVGGALATMQRNHERHRLSLMDERSVIARELHDSLAQSLSYLKIQVTRLQALLSGKSNATGPVMDVVQELRDGLNEAYRQLRELLTTFRLRIDDRGLRAAIEDSIQAFTHRTHVPVRLADHLEHIDLSPEREIHVLQIIREALANIEHHARATQVEICLEQTESGHLRVRISDNGIGMDTSNPPLNRYGLVIMRDRAHSLDGNLLVSRRLAGGTEVQLQFPHDALPRENGITLP